MNVHLAKWSGDHDLEFSGLVRIGSLTEEGELRKLNIVCEYYDTILDNCCELCWVLCDCFCGKYRN